MRLLRLEIAGFGPYRDRFEIDFSAFDADGVYLIAGPTGAGKSSILDAVSFALYGSAPRYEERPHLRSDLAGPGQPTWVELDFAVGDRVLQVRRSPEYERQKQRGSGTTREKASAQLLELTGGSWEPLATSVGEVSVEVGAILGLSKEEFLKVILLAQGGFAEFLAASSDDRKQLLRRLFGTGSMRRLRELLLADAKSLDDARGAMERSRDDCAARALSLLGASGEAAEPGQPVVDEGSLGAVEARLAEQASTVADAARAARDGERTARTARDEAQTRTDRFRRRADATSALAALEAAATAVDADRGRLADAERAAEAAAALDRWARADGEAAHAAASLEEAAAGLPEGVEAQQGRVADAHEAALDAAARGSEAQRLEDELPALANAAAEAERAASAAEASAAAARKERADAPAARQALDEARGKAAALAARMEPAERTVEAARARLAARQDADALAEPLQDAKQAAAASASAQMSAAREALRLQEVRIAGIAGELAAQLVEGEPCLVCGGAEHPSPHAPVDDAVTADDVVAALEQSERALAEARTANAELSRLERRLVAYETSAGDGDAPTLRVALHAARAAHAAALAAVGERDRLIEAIDAHDEAARGLDARVGRLEEEASMAHAAAAAADARLDDARARLERLLDGHEGAASLLAAAARGRDALGRWLDAERARSASLDEQTEAAAEAARSLVEHGLPDRETAAAMRLDAPVRTALRERIRAHDDAVASARGVLAQPDLAELEGEAPALQHLEEALLEAERKAAAAADAAAAAATTRDHAARDLETARRCIRDLADGAEEAATLRAVAAALHGDNELRQDIETYVLGTRLATIIEAANLRLAAMTSGRFTLVHDEARASHGRASGLGILVLDAHTGIARTTKSLSGGETFLASLSLALGLADVVQAESGGVSLETLFIDEGFGSLDQDALEAALATLDELRAGGRSVGVISHVQQMQERIPTRIRVVPVAGGGSRIEAVGVARPVLVGAG